MTGATPHLDAATREALSELLLAMADDEFVIGFWDSEWTGIAPMLEEDVATSSIAQDEIGHARALYEMLAALTGTEADTIAYGRDPAAYRHSALLNHARGDWAFSVARRYLYETADSVRLAALAGSTHQPLAALVAKVRREETYHLMHAEAWIERLARTDRLADAVRALWPDAQATFAPLAGEERLLAAGVLPRPMTELHAAWVARVRPTLEAIAGALPDQQPPADGRLRRTGDFAWLHEQLTMVSASEAGAQW